MIFKQGAEIEQRHIYRHNRLLTSFLAKPLGSKIDLEYVIAQRLQLYNNMEQHIRLGSYRSVISLPEEVKTVDTICGITESSKLALTLEPDNTFVLRYNSHEEDDDYFYNITCENDTRVKLLGKVEQQSPGVYVCHVVDGQYKSYTPTSNV